MPKLDDDIELELDEAPSNVTQLRRPKYTFPFAFHLDADIGTLDKLSRGLIRPTPTPWSSVNEILDGGLWPEPYFLNGKPGTGKTQMAFQLMVSHAQMGNPVLYVGLETPRVQSVTRLLSILADVPWSSLYRGKEKSIFAQAKEQVGLLSTLPIHSAITDVGGWHYKYLSYAADEIRAMYPHRRLLVVVDFLQIVEGDERDDLRKVVRSAAYQGAFICKEYGDVCCLFLSAVSRENYKLVDMRDRSKGKLPPIGVGDPSWLIGIGKETGEIEYAAANLLALCHNEEGNPVLALPKARAGGKAWAGLTFDGQKFLDLSETII